MMINLNKVDHLDRIIEESIRERTSVISSLGGTGVRKQIWKNGPYYVCDPQEVPLFLNEHTGPIPLDQLFYFRSRVVSAIERDRKNRLTFFSYEPKFEPPSNSDAVIDYFRVTHTRNPSRTFKVHLYYTTQLPSQQLQTVVDRMSHIGIASETYQPSGERMAGNRSLSQLSGEIDKFLEKYKSSFKDFIRSFDPERIVGEDKFYDSIPKNNLRIHYVEKCRQVLGAFCSVEFAKDSELLESLERFKKLVILPIKERKDTMFDMITNKFLSILPGGV